MKYDVFISCKSEDYNIGRQVYEFLVNYRGLDINVFMADKELRKQGNADYGKIIDEALDSSTHLVIVSSNADYLKEETSSYVYEEWHTFVEEIRSGRKKGNIMTIFTESVQLKDVPIAIRNRQSFPFTEYSSIVNYLNISNNNNAETISLEESSDNQEEDDVEIDLDYEDALDFMKDGEYQDAIHSLITSFENSNKKTLNLFNKILFLNFGNVDWDSETWEFFEQQAAKGYSFANLSYFYKFARNKSTHLTAIEYLKKALADKQNGYVYLCEGIAREKGIGIRPNLRSATKRYDQALKMGVIEAISYLAEMNLNGNSGLEIDRDLAMAMLETGCDQGDARSHYILAKLYSSDLSQSENFEKAVELYKQAAILNIPQSWLALGKLYQNNIYINNRWGKAIEYYFEAIKNGVKDGHAYLAKLYWKQQEYEKAKIEAERGVNNGSVLSMSVLGEIYEEGMPDVDKLIVVHEPDIPKAWYYYQQAFFNGGRVEDAISMARLYVNEDFRPENITWDTIESYLNEGAKVPLREAIDLMAKALRANGREEDALKYIKIGAESGMLDMMYEYGIRAMSVDTGEALKFLSNAAQKGHIPSIIKMLEYSKDQGIKSVYEDWMSIAVKNNIDVPIDDYAENLFTKRPAELWTYLKNIYETQENYAALFWMAYYYLHHLEIEEKESIWLYNVYTNNFNNISILATSAYDLFAKLLCVKCPVQEYNKEIEKVHNRHKQYINYWISLHGIDNIQDGHIIYNKISDFVEQNKKELNNEWIQKYNILSKRALIRAAHITIVGEYEEDSSYLKEILEFFDYSVSCSSSIDVVSQINTKESGSILIYLVMCDGGNEMPQTIADGDSYVAYIDVKKDLNEARSCYGKLRAISEELISNRITSFIFNLIKERYIVNYSEVRTISTIQHTPTKTILHVEDEKSNHELFRIPLSKRYNLLWAKNGIEACVIAEEKHPDMIFMDIRLPEMNGLDATRIIKEISPQTPIVALSAYSFQENVAEAKEAGVDDFMSKPFRVEDLIECVRRYIGV